MSVPGLIIQGGHDCQIPPENGERLIRTAPDNQYAEIATMNHVLKATPADCAAAIASYNNLALPLHQELVPAITRFYLPADVMSADVFRQGVFFSVCRKLL